MKRALIVGIATLFLVLPFSAWAASIPSKVYENGTDNNPVALSGVKVQVLGGYGFKAVLSSGESGADGSCLLNNVPLGREVLVKLAKPGYIAQYDVRSYSEADVEKGVIFWIGSEANVEGLYKSLGEGFDFKKGHIYLEINDEMTGEGIEGVQLAASSGKVFDLGQGEYLIANAEGASLKIGIEKPGYAFDIETATLPLFAGAMTQSYVKVQVGGSVIESGQVTAAGTISGHIVRLSDSVPISGVTVAFITGRNTTAAPSVLTNENGFYQQTGFVPPPPRAYRVVASKPPWSFKAKTVIVGSSGATADFKGF